VCFFASGWPAERGHRVVVLCASRWAAPRARALPREEAGRGCCVLALWPLTSCVSGFRPPSFPLLSLRGRGGVLAVWGQHPSCPCRPLHCCGLGGGCARTSSCFTVHLYVSMTPSLAEGDVWRHRPSPPAPVRLVVGTAVGSPVGRRAATTLSSVPGGSPPNGPIDRPHLASSAAPPSSNFGAVRRQAIKGELGCAPR
jgi:hypothetical protein